jgi:hypothetical protein
VTVESSYRCGSSPGRGKKVVGSVSPFAWFAYCPASLYETCRTGAPADPVTVKYGSPPPG